MKYKLAEIGKVVGGGTPSTKHPEYYTDSGILWLTPKDLSGYDEMFISKGSRDITQKGMENSSAKLLPVNSILVSSRAPIGYVAIAQNAMATNQGFKSIIPNEELVIPEYLYFVMKTSKKDLEQIASGSTFKEVSTKVMSNFEVDIPSLDEQKRVLSYLLPITKQIEKNSKINDNLLELSDTLFKKMFKLDGDNLISNYLLPKRGKNLLKKNVIPGKVPVVAGGLKPAAFHNESNTKAPVITISASGANAGFLQIWGQEVWSSDSSYIDPAIAENIFFWYILLKNKQEQIFDAQSGSAQPHIYPKHIGNLLVPSLNMIRVREFNNLVTPIFNKIFQNQKENNSLEELKEYLLKKYFN
jgi:restriction endonuclease S subunit